MKMKLYIAVLLSLLGCSCGNDFLDISPSNSAGDANLINSVSDLRIATEGVYEVLTSSSYYAGEYTFVADLMGDHMMEPSWGSQHLKYFYAYGLTKVSAGTGFYRLIYLGLQDINLIIEKAEKLENTPEKEALIAELRTLRALLHFDLVRMYGPMYGNLGKGAIKSDALGIRVAGKAYKDVREVFYRGKVSDVYGFICTELEEAVPLLSVKKRNGYFDYWGGRALQAKVYLYMEKDGQALAAAEDVIKNSGCELYSRDEYVASWGKEYGSESLLELPTSLEDNAGYTSLGWICSEAGYKTVVPTRDFLDLVKADPEDVRFKLLRYSSKDKCYYISGKYPGREGNIKINNPKVLRLSEVYLIAAEAALKTNDMKKAGDYLGDLRKQRTTTDPDKYKAAVTLEDVLYERVVELYGEGSRAWDLWRNRKPVIRWRTPQEKDEKGHTDNLESGVIPFDFFQTIYPINERELELLPLKDRESQQNPGY